jgi:hypothetical protein
MNYYYVPSSYPQIHFYITPFFPLLISWSRFSLHCHFPMNIFPVSFSLLLTTQVFFSSSLCLSSFTLPSIFIPVPSCFYSTIFPVKIYIRTQVRSESRIRKLDNQNPWILITCSWNFSIIIFQWLMSRIEYDTPFNVRLLVGVRWQYQYL